MDLKTLPADLALDARTGLPEDLKVLIAQYPREVWTSHGNLGEMAKFWGESFDRMDDYIARLKSGKEARNDDPDQA